MASQTLKRIVGPVNVGTGTSTVFTGTAAHIYTIKFISIVNATASPITIKLGIQASAAALDDDELFLPTATIDAGGLAEWEGTLVLTGTEVIRATTSATGLTFTASGLDQN